MRIKSHAIRPEVTTDSETELSTINTFLQNICRKCTHSFNFHLQLGIALVQDRLECRNALAFGPSDLQCLRNVCQGSRVLTPGSCHETQNESFLWTGDLVGLSEHLLSSTHLVFLELEKKTPVTEMYNDFSNLAGSVASLYTNWKKKIWPTWLRLLSF